MDYICPLANICDEGQRDLHNPCGHSKPHPFCDGICNERCKQPVHKTHAEHGDDDHTPVHCLPIHDLRIKVMEAIIASEV
jgi:hypothetical protein